MSLWNQFKTKYLHDYSGLAVILWLLVALVGTGVMLYSGYTVLKSFLPSLSVIIGMSITSFVIATYPIRIPRTTQVFVAGDLVVYLAMIMFGPAVAAITSGIEGSIGAMRSSKRFSSYVFSGGVSAITALCAGLMYQWIFQKHLLPGPTWMFVSLFASVCFHWVFQTSVLFTLIRLKSRKGFDLAIGPWLSIAAAPGAMQFAAALAAAILYVIWGALPGSSIGIVVAFISASLLLMFWNFKQLLLERQRQEQKMIQAQQETIEHQQKIKHLAYHDALTGLANRRKLNHALNAAFFRSEKFALLYLDLDRFKLVNDSFGHAAGDELLVEVSKRLQSAIRRDDVVSRVGGDEFCVLISGYHSRADVVRVAESIIESMTKPLMIQRTDVRPLLSIGIAFSEDHKNGDQLLTAADVAMYYAKREGRGRAKVFDDQMNVSHGQHLQLESDLREAIQTKRIELRYQPIVHLKTRKITGFEALARWDRTPTDHVSPAVFVTLAEESPLILQLTEFVIQAAVKQLSIWNNENIVIHVNVSARDIASETFVPFIQRTLEEHSVNPHSLAIELTERTVMSDREQSFQTLKELSMLGVQLSIDDFGTGYSSLSYLSSLPFDCLKIDQSFVADLATSNENREIAAAVVALAEALKKDTIAEGVETEEQLQELIRIGAAHGQGHLFYPALDAVQAEQVLKNYSSD